MIAGGIAFCVCAALIVAALCLLPFLLWIAVRAWPYVAALVLVAWLVKAIVF